MIFPFFLSFKVLELDKEIYKLINSCLINILMPKIQAFISAFY